MSTRRIIVYGHPSLRKVAGPVREVDGEVAALITDLFDTMYEAPGIGLAAPQVDTLLRVVVVDPTPLDEPGTRKLALVNPEVLEYSGSEVREEGCLSIPGVYADVRRPARILVAYVDPEGKERQEEMTGIMARVVQHEIDHLDGKLFVDHLSAMRRSLLRRRLREIERSGAAAGGAAEEGAAP